METLRRKRKGFIVRKRCRRQRELKQRQRQRKEAKSRCAHDAGADSQDVIKTGERKSQEGLKSS